MTRAFFRCFISLLMGAYFASETALTQGCDGTCSSKTCYIPFYGTCCHKKNIARDSQHTSQSSDYTERGRYFLSDLAVDGNTNTDFNNNTCTHTYNADDTDAWWMIDLDSTYNISEIKLYLRNNNKQRYKDLRVFVNSHECFRAKTPPEESMIQCSPSIPGSVVKVYVNNVILTLCEVQIFVCDPGWYGEECDRQCNCRDSADCDHASGWCRDGCRAGKQGDSCQCDCEDGAYGLDCRESCGHCLGGKVCDKVTGSCGQDCVQGFKPPLCKECNDEKFGINCLSTCGKCSGNENCNKTDGTCQNGCLEHYIPPMCTECKDGRFGINCQSTCGKCEGNESCNKTDGTCPNGCEERYNPPMCTDCVGGRYGENCDRKCGHCLNDLPCNMTTGECGDFCSSDYKPPLCDDCVRGRYGTDCMSICGQCADNATCSSDGTCPRGCLPGFTDELCQTLVSTVPSNIAPIAGGVAAVIVLMIIIVVVIVILKRRLQRKPTTTVANRGENQKDTSFIDISEPPGGGTDYYSVIPAPVNLPKLARYIKDRINGVGFDNEFKLLPYGIHEDYDEGKKPENRKRNRFLELYPCIILFLSICNNLKRLFNLY